jgi:hypothetical protein
VAVDSAVGLVVPIYLVVDPDVPDKREWIYVRTINGNNLENLVRNQQGSVGDIDHDAGAKIRAIFTKQLQDDIFEDIEDLEGALLAHAQDHGDPHANAGYLKESDGDSRYVRLNGFDPMTGPLTLWGDPTNALHAATKQYVDGQDHDHATPIATHTAIVDAHHARYTDAEAVAAQGTSWLPLHGTADAAAKWATARTLTVQMAGDVSGAANASLDGTANKTITVTAVVANDSHTHDTQYYGKATADGRFAPKSHTHSYLPLAGGTLTGVLHLPAGVDGGTALRFGNMGEGDGLYGANTEFSVAMSGSRRLTVWPPSQAGSRDTGIVEIRGGGAPYILAGDNNGVGFKLTATALKWLADNHN